MVSPVTSYTQIPAVQSLNPGKEERFISSLFHIRCISHMLEATKKKNTAFSCRPAFRNKPFFVVCLIFSFFSIKMRKKEKQLSKSKKQDFDQCTRCTAPVCSPDIQQLTYPLTCLATKTWSIERCSFRPLLRNLLLPCFT